MSGLARYAFQRLLLTIPMIFILLTVIFIVIRVIPGDPVTAVLGARPVSPELRATYQAKMGVDKPIFVQYVKYIGGVFQGDFGESMRTSTPVIKELFSRFPATIELALFGLLIAGILGFTTGILASTRADRTVDHVVRVFHIGSFAVPVFWLGLMFQVIFAVKLPGFRLRAVSAQRWHLPSSRSRASTFWTRSFAGTARRCLTFSNTSPSPH